MHTIMGLHARNDDFGMRVLKIWYDLPEDFDSTSVCPPIDGKRGTVDDDHTVRETHRKSKIPVGYHSWVHDTSVDGTLGYINSV